MPLPDYNDKREQVPPTTGCDDITVAFTCVGVPVRIRCDDKSIATLLGHNFAAMQEQVGQCAELDYRLTAAGRDRIRIERDGHTFEVADTGGLLLTLESDLVVQVQKRRPELLFLHSAVLVRDGRCHLLVGHSGAGKSTTCWGMVSRGFGYRSDEMAPIDPHTLDVLAYPHALCLKSPPPPEFPLPVETLRTSRGFHVPTSTMRSVCCEGALPLASVLFVEYDPAQEVTVCVPTSPAEATARVYPNVLNALAHANAGLDAVAHLAASCKAWQLRFSSLTDALLRIEGLSRSTMR